MDFPIGPANVPAEVTAPSESFRAKVRNVIIAILVFVLTYLVMVGLAAALAWYCVKAGFIVMLLRLSWLSLLVGAGIIVMGFLVVFFMIKFLFATSSGGDEHGMEISEQDEPKLFEFIHRVADEVGAQHPKRVILIPDVNASVFYHSSFWSLFFPTRKNLNIGLGLVNSLNLGEFKAVLAHEFGHFSQKSMSLGSYVYYVNQVIFNMLFRNNGWVGTATGIASIHNILAFFVRLAVYIVQGVQWVLRGMYMIVNRQYLSLSREMEFHADAIAAAAAGSNNMTQALRQVEFGSITYQQTIDKCNEMLSDKKGPRNAYAGQTAIASYMADWFALPVKKGVPTVTSDFINGRQHSRVVFKNQWASHPTREEREAQLNALNLVAGVSEASAWELFKSPVEWQKELTDFLYKDLEFRVKNVEDEEFTKSLLDERLQREYPRMYKGYFEGHTMYTGKWSEVVASAQARAMAPGEWEQYFHENLDEKLGALNQDMEVLKAIAEGRIDTKTFDFDGQKYDKYQVEEVKAIIQKAITDTTTLRNNRDTDAAEAFYAHALAVAPAKAEALKSSYEALDEWSRLKNGYFTYAIPIASLIHALAANNFEMTKEYVDGFRTLQLQHMPALRRFFNEMPSLEVFPSEAREQITTMFTGPAVEFIQMHQPHRTNIENLYTAIVTVSNAMSQISFNRQKAVLILQEEIVKR